MKYLNCFLTVVIIITQIFDVEITGLDKTIYIVLLSNMTTILTKLEERK